MNAEQNAENAKRLLRHYLSMAVEARGYRFDGDNKAEIDDLVDYLVAAAKPEPAQQAVNNGAPMQTTGSDALLNQAVESLEAYERSHAEAEEHQRNEETYKRSVAQSAAIYQGYQTQMRTSIANVAALNRIASVLESIAKRLDGFSDNGEENDALRVNVLR